MTIPANTRLGRYEIRSKLGAGGMGEVYRARDTELGREVAIKVLPPSFSADTNRLHRFRQEACSASALNHPNILIVHDIGTHDGSPYIVSELLEGETLRPIALLELLWANVAPSSMRYRSLLASRLHTRRE